MMETIGYSVEDNSDIEKSVLDAAKKHFSNADYDSAIKLYLGLLKTSASSKLYLEVGLCYYKKNEFDIAIEYLIHATTMDNKNATAFSYLGNCYFRKLDANKAIENWTNARSLSPQDEFVCLNLAIAYFAKNKSYESIFYYDKFLKYAQNKDTTQYKSIQSNMNDLFRNANDLYTKGISTKGFLAEEYFINATKKYPIISEYTKKTADYYFLAKNYQQAIYYYNLTIRDNLTHNKNIFINLAECYIKLSDYRMGICFYTRALKYSMSIQKEYLELTRNISNLKKMIDKSSSEVTLELANNYYNNNEYYQALIEYENYTILNPNKKTEFEPKINKLKSFVNAEDRVTNEYIQLGNQLLLKGENQNANKYFSKVIEMSNPKSKEYKLAKTKLVNV